MRAGRYAGQQRMPQHDSMRFPSGGHRVSGSVVWLVLAALFALTALVYWPSLSGGYLFDDGYYVQDPNIQVTTLRLGAWARAALSQAGANQFRALSMLSFAANYYLTGPDPWWFKFTNVLIHLLNGVLLFQVLVRLLRLHADTRPSVGSDEPALPGEWVAAAVTGLWLLAPINLTGVAYVSQRIESLATVFVFLGLLLYLRARQRHYQGNGTLHPGWIAMVACTIAGMTAKESAALLPLYTFCIEFAITRFRNGDGRWSSAAVGTHVVFLLLPLLAGLYWISHWDFAAVAHIRTFTIGQRLLTEPRVLVDYLGWTLFPNLQSLTFYHDDIAVSHGLLTPPTTLAAIAFLAALLGVAIWQRQRRPLFCLGILWFFAGHAMTATIIPLELVFEHRNYFPSVGVFLAVGSLASGIRGGTVRRVTAATACIAIAYFAFTTFLRAEEWSNPLRLAFAEASKRPESMRAQYGLAQTLIVAAGKNPQSPLLDESRKVLDRIVARPDSGIGPAQALIYLDGRAHRDVDPALWRSILQKLHGQPMSETDVASVIFLYRCMQHRDCPMQAQPMLEVFIAATESSGYDPNVMTAYSDFAFLVLHDAQLAERLTRDTVERHPHVPTYRQNLIILLLASGQPDKAAIELDRLRAMNRMGWLDAPIADLEAKLAQVRRSLPVAAKDSAAPPGSSPPVPQAP
jgi:hypothetical protein